MTPPDHQRRYEALLAAVATLTADLDREGLGNEVFLSYIEDDDLTDPELMYAFRNLAAILLIKLEKAGHDPREVLQDIAGRYRPT